MNNRKSMLLMFGGDIKLIENIPMPIYTDVFPTGNAASFGTEVHSLGDWTAINASSSVELSNDSEDGISSIKGITTGSPNFTGAQIVFPTTIGKKYYWIIKAKRGIGVAQYIANWLGVVSKPTVSITSTNYGVYQNSVVANLTTITLRVYSAYSSGGFTGDTVFVDWVKMYELSDEAASRNGSLGTPYSPYIEGTNTSLMNAIDSVITYSDNPIGGELTPRITATKDAGRANVIFTGIPNSTSIRVRMFVRLIKGKTAKIKPVNLFSNFTEIPIINKSGVEVVFDTVTINTSFYIAIYAAEYLTGNAGDAVEFDNISIELL